MILAASLAATLLGCGIPTYDYRKEPDPRQHEYVLGVLDVVKVTVWKNAELSAEVAVRPDGAITLPLIGDVRADGATPSQLQKEIATRLAAFVRDEAATVTVSVTGINSYRFTVAGNVEHPGLLTAKSYLTVSEALALAGGPNKFASRLVYLVRSDGKGKTRRIPLDSEALSSGARPDENLVILPGDTLYVP
jgi:polysaccharide export outer membrane protein